MKEIQQVFDYFIENNEYEDGLNHPIEPILDDLVQVYGQDEIIFTISEYIGCKKSIKKKSTMIKCISRIEEINNIDILVKIIKKYINNPNIEIRDSIIQLIEQKINKENEEILLKLLVERYRIEQVMWLKDYILKLILEIQNDKLNK